MTDFILSSLFVKLYWCSKNLVLRLEDSACGSLLILTLISYNWGRLINGVPMLVFHSSNPKSIGFYHSKNVFSFRGNESI